jgi:hypothetical protein
MKSTRQKSFPLLLALLLAAPAVAFAAAQVQPSLDPNRQITRMFLTQAPAQMVAEQIHELIGARKSLLVDQDVKGNVSLLIENKSAKTAEDELRKALRDQAGVEVLDLPGEIMHVRRYAAQPRNRPVMGNPPIVIWRFYSSKEPVEQIFGHIRLLTGREIVADTAVQQLFGESHAIVLRFVFRDTPLEFVLEAFRDTLKKEAGIVLDEQPDGSYRARLAAKPAAPVAPAAAPAPAKQP